MRKRGETYALKLLREVEALSADDPIRPERLADICAAIPGDIVSPVGRETLADAARRLVLQPPSPGRLNALQLLLAIRGDDTPHILATSFTFVGAGFAFSGQELAELVLFLRDRCRGDVDLLVEQLYTEAEKHAGNAAARELLEVLERRVRIAGLRKVTGPGLRNALFTTIIDTERSDEHWLLQGPSGSGKTYVASIIHGNSARRACEFKVFECGKSLDVRKSLVRDVREGRLDGGTVFIDELHHLERGRQSVLYNALNGRSIQVVTASSKPLPWLRSNIVGDFFGRYCVNVFVVKPLRERFLDFREFVRRHFKEEYSKRVDPTLVRVLFDSHDWQHNYREVMAFAEGVCKNLPNGTHDITYVVLRENASAFSGDVVFILDKISEFQGESHGGVSGEFQGEATKPRN
jgi:hypothetical protein